MISVIISHHQGILLYDVLKSLRPQMFVDFETIVVSTLYLDNPILRQAWRENQWVKFLQCDGGPDQKRNLGAKYAQGEFLAFFDDDVELTSSALFEMEKTIKSCDMVFGKLHNAEFRDRFDEAGSYLTWTGFLWSRAGSHIVDEGQYDKEEPILAGKSASCMIRTSKFKEIKGFDTDFGILGEETDLAWRVWKSGGKVMWCPKSLTYHKFNTKWKSPDFYTHERVYYNGCKNYVMMLVKNLEVGNLWKILPIHVSFWLISAMGMILTGKFKAGWNILRGLAWNLTHFSHNRRKWSESVSDKMLFPLILRQPSLSYYLVRFYRYLKLGLHG